MPSADDTLPASGGSLATAFDALVATLHDRGVSYAIIGGLAAIQYTRVRTTDDIDALLSLPQIAMPGFFEALGDRGFSVDVPRNVREFRDGGLTTIRFGEVVVDLMRPVIPAFGHVLDRARTAEVMGRTVRISAPEGLIVMKLIAMRPQDEADIRDLLAAQGDKLDVDFVRSELETFTDAHDPRRAKFESWVRRSGDEADTAT